MSISRVFLIRMHCRKKSPFRLCGGNKVMMDAQQWNRISNLSDINSGKSEICSTNLIYVLQAKRCDRQSIFYSHSPARTSAEFTSCQGEQHSWGGKLSMNDNVVWAKRKTTQNRRLRKILLYCVFFYGLDTARYISHYWSVLLDFMKWDNSRR